MHYFGITRGTLGGKAVPHRIVDIYHHKCSVITVIGEILFVTYKWHCYGNITNDMYFLFFLNKLHLVVIRIHRHITTNMNSQDLNKNIYY